MIKKNDIVCLEIVDIGQDGYGIGKYSDGELKNFVIYVPFVAVGDKIRCKILKVLSSYAFGKVEEIIVKSPHRIEPDCKSFGKCGGCVFRHIDYEAELEYKKNSVVQAYKREFGSDFDIKINEVKPSEQTEGYRNKVEYPISVEGKCSFYAKKSQRTVDIVGCKLQDASFEQIVKAFEGYVSEFNVSVYDEQTKKGVLRHLFLRIGENSGDISVCVVANKKKIPFEEELVKRMSEINGVKSLWLNCNTKDTNVILSDDYRLIWGEKYIIDDMCGVKVRISPQSFYQINKRQAQKLYSDALEMAGEYNNLLDLYCGIGCIGLCAAKKAKRVLGVEIVPEAIEDAKAIAKINNIENAQFYTSDANRLSEVLKEADFVPDTVVVDPPRKGLDEETIRAILKINPKKIVYISCNPHTQSRDVKKFSECGYEIKEIAPYDMFPRTYHVETIALLSREKVDEHIYFDVNVQNLPKTV